VVIDVVRLGKLITAIYTDNEGSRTAAAGRLYDWMITNHVHPDDVVVDVKGERDARFDRLMQRFEEENRKLRRENDFFVAHADASLRAKAQKAGLIENRWEEFAKLICERLRVKELPARGWQEPVLEVTGVGKTQLQSWRHGLARIPETAFDKVRAVTALSLKRAKPVEKRTKRNSHQQPTLPV